MKFGSFFLLVTFFHFVFTSSCSNPPGRVSAPVLEAGPVENFVVDGKGSEWSEIPWISLYADPLGNQPDEEDLQARIKLSATDDYIGILAEIRDDLNYRDTLNPWNGDAIEVFLSDFRGSENTIQISFALPESESDEVFILIQDRFKDKCEDETKPEVVAQAGSVMAGNLRTLEIRIGTGFLPAGSIPAIQVYVDDSDLNQDPDRKQLVLFPVGHSYVNSFAMFTLKQIQGIPERTNGSSRLLIRDNRELELSVFGLEAGREVSLLKSGTEVLFKGVSEGEVFRKNLGISDLSIDLSADTLIVLAGNEPVGFHELLIAPRIYDSIPPPRFEREIAIFKMRDAISPPETGGTVFVGSSSIRMWTCIYEDFPELNVVHRGFGGSTSEEALLYVEDIVIPYKPSTVVYYEGDNDVPSGMSPGEVVENIRLFIEKVRLENPDTRFFLISPKPSIKRMHLWDKYLQVHSAMKEYSESVEGVFFIDVATPMFDEEGNLKTGIFIEDGIHMNREGYLIWKQVIRNALELEVNQEMEN